VTDGASTAQRPVGLLGAIGIGIGAIVGGGILALAGVAFEATGPGAILAFALNGGIALLTALSFAEMSAAFPESGGTYTFAKKVLSVEAAFAVGWIVWFASIVAGVLYALGFASYGMIALNQLWGVRNDFPTGRLSGPWVETAVAVGATAIYTLSLVRRSPGGGQWATWGKLAVFAVLIAGGLWALPGRPVAGVHASLTPFLPGGAAGLFQAMGYTFIALQGFDLIAAVAGEVRDPGRTIPRAMLLSLAAALAIYLPLLFVIATVGVSPGQSIITASAAYPDTIVAIAAGNFLGRLGFWLVIVAAILSMLSALEANLLAASRIAFSMARDRNLPRILGRIDERRGTPQAAVVASAVTLTIILLVVRDVATAGAAASLIFLISFALAHWTSILARRRGGVGAAVFRVPCFPLVPAAGGLSCLALAVFQGIVVPPAGVLASVWLGCGVILFVLLLARRARVVDASAEAYDPHLVRLRGRSPLVLVPIANPANAEAMVAVATALAPPNVGRVLLLSVVAAPPAWQPGAPPRQLVDAQQALREALMTSFAAGLAPEALTTVAQHPWVEIDRVARIHRCESLLLGLSNLTEQVMGTPMEDLMSRVDCNVIVMRAAPGWQLSQARQVLVPVGGRGDHDALRARLLGSLFRVGRREVTYLRVLPGRSSAAACAAARRRLLHLAEDEVPARCRVEVVRSDSIAAALTRQAAESDLVILGLQRLNRRRKLLGEIAVNMARDTTCPLIMISRRG
jgi:APA family basic amino acid/polyamine antiporter